MSSFTRQEYVDLRFQEPGSVAKGSLVWHAALDQAQAHDNLFGVVNIIGGNVGKSVSYEDLVLRCAQRIWISGLPQFKRAEGD